jgi:tetratricopeptide (TPR) repeat protein
VKRALLISVLIALTVAGVLGYASSRRERSYRALIEQGDVALSRGESFAAVEAFTVAIAIKPGSMLGYLRRGEAYRQYGELEPALKDVRTASQLDPSATRPLEVLGDLEHDLKRYDRASARFEEYVRIDDRSPRVLYKLALSRYYAGNPAGAVEALRAALKINEGFAEAFYLMGLCQEALRKPGEARASLQRALALEPQLIDAREELADLHHRASRSEQRLAQLEELIAIEPDSPSRQVSLGLAHADAGQFDRAVVVLSRAVERFPTYPFAYVALGRVWLEVAQARGDNVALRKALEALERGAVAEGSSEALMLLGRALLASGQPERAATVLLEATTKIPIDPLAFSYLADAAERIGNVPIARGALLDYHALEGDPADTRRRARLFERIGDLSARMGEPTMAVTWLQRSAAADPGGVDVALLVRLANALWRAGDPIAARASVTRALEKDPSNQAALALSKKLPKPI